MKNKTLKRSFAAALSVSVMATAQAVSFAAATRNDTSANLFADDFESYAAGGVSMATMPKWYMKDDLAACAIAEDGANQVLKIANTTGAPVIAMAQGTTEKVQQTPVTISFDIKVPSGSDEVWGLVCPVMEETNNIDETNFGQNQMVQIKGTGDSASIVVGESTISISRDVWYKVVIDENLGSSGNWSYVVSVYDASDTLVGSDSKTNSEYMGSFQNINFTAWRTGAYYVDNLKIDKISRGVELSDDMEYTTVAEASKYWVASNNSFEKIDEAHGMTAKAVSWNEFHPCTADVVSSGIVNIQFDTYLKGDNTGSGDTCGAVFVLPEGYSDMGASTARIIEFKQRAQDENVEFHVGDSWINQCPTGWYTVKIALDLDNSKYDVSVTSASGNNYCVGEGGVSKTSGMTANAVSTFAAVNFRAASSTYPFYFDNFKLTCGADEPKADISAESTTVTAQKNSDTDKATGFFTTITNKGAAAGPFNKISYVITSGGVTNTFNGTASTEISLEPNASAYVGLIVNGLYDESPAVSVTVE